MNEIKVKCIHYKDQINKLGYRCIPKNGDCIFFNGSLGNKLKQCSSFYSNECNILFVVDWITFLLHRDKFYLVED